MNKLYFEDLINKLSDDYNQDYGKVFDLALYTRNKLFCRYPKYYIKRFTKVNEDTYNLLDRFYRRREYIKSTNEYKTLHLN
jgi:hypothetical protein